MRLVAALVLASLGLAGCRTLATGAGAPPPDPAAAEAAQRARTRALGLAGGDCGAPAWSMAGRVALSNGKDGGSGQLEWTQGAGAVRMTLSAPITRQNWVLDVDAGGATLQGVPGGPVHAMDATALLREATGWDIPVGALGCWLRGAAAGSAGSDAPRIVYGGDLLPVRIEQGGWSIDYGGWQADAASGLPMPSRINAQRGADRVRLVVDRWGVE